MAILVYVEHTEGKFKKSAFEVVSYASALAAKMGTSLSALAIGAIENSELLKLADYGAQKILHASPDSVKGFVNQAYASIVAEAATSEQADVVCLSNTFSAKGLAPRIAVKLGASFGNGVVDLPDLSDGKFCIKTTAFSGKAFSFEELTQLKKVITISPNSFGVTDQKTSGNIVPFSATLGSTDLGTLIKEIVRNTDKISLPDAERVVSAGRGLKGPENWKMVEELAELLGAATACSKPVSDAGWRPHSEHVGQTGITISPNLYIAIGISGAIQHIAGVSSSKVIVVINTDPEAPFFKVADYGIVGDAFDVIPKLIEAVKANR